MPKPHSALLSAVTTACREAVTTFTNKSIDSASQIAYASQIFSQNFLRDWIFQDSIPETCSLTPPSNGPFLFLFLKNATVTNLQFVEFNALLTSYCRSKDDTLPGTFLTTDHFKSIINDVFQTALYDVTSLEAIVTDDDSLAIRLTNRLMQLYADMLSHVVIVDLYLTSASVYVPPTMHLDIYKITKLSGYIHSAGVQMYVREASKADVYDLRSKINKFAESASTPFTLVPYAKEYFLPFESGAHSTRNGLDGVMLQGSKHHLRDINLSQFLGLLAKGNEKILIPPGLNPYNQERVQQVDSGACQNFSIWFITDREMEYISNKRRCVAGERNYFIVYIQYVFNDNPLAIFKERKPGWLQSVTLPHTLCRAMLNTSRPGQIKAPEETRIFDPFLGTGTTLFDAVSVFPRCHFTGVDLEHSSRQAIIDNAEFFSLSSSSLKTLRRFFEGIYENDSQQRINRETIQDALLMQDMPKDIGAKVNWIASRLFMPRNGTDEILTSHAQPLEQLSPALLSTMMSYSFHDRMLMWIIWRSIKMNYYQIIRQGFAAVDQALRHEVNERFIVELSALISIRENQESSPNGGDEISGTYNSLYSRGVGESAGFFKELGGRINRNEGINVVSGIDCREYMRLNVPNGSIDIIVTDPPYGFNISNEGADLSLLSVDIVREFVRILDRRGQLLMCLPAGARTGKMIPYSQTRAIIANAVLREANRANRTLTWFLRSQIAKNSLINPPYYWGGHAAVSRDILHFTLDT